MHAKPERVQQLLPSLPHSEMQIFVLVCFFYFQSDNSSSQWYKNPSREIFCSLSSSKIETKKPVVQEKLGLCGKVVCQGWPLVAFLSVFCFRKSSEHFQKWAYEKILSRHMGSSPCARIGDYPCQVQIVKWQALEEHQWGLPPHGVWLSKGGGLRCWYVSNPNQWKHMKPDRQRACSSNVLGETWLHIYKFTGLSAVWYKI